MKQAEKTISIIIFNYCLLRVECLLCNSIPKYILKKIMKNVSLVLSLSIILLLGNILSCSSQSESLKGGNNSGTNYVKGKILMAQNEPFAKLALVTDSTVYLLNYSDEIKEILYNNQGKTAKVYYKSISRNEESINVLNVDKVEIVNSND